MEERKKIPNENTVGQQLLQMQKKQHKKEKWIRTRMWISNFMSLFHGDHSVIPSDIGDRILFSNNMLVTKHGLNAYIIVTDLSEHTPVTFTSDLLKTVKRNVHDVRIDFMFSGKRYYPDVTSDAAQHRYNMWTKVLDDSRVGSRIARRCARLAYTFEEIRAGAAVYQTHFFIRVSAKTGVKLSQAMDAISNYLDTYEATYAEVQNNIKFYAQYIMLISRTKTKNVKDISASIFSAQTLAESFPCEQGYNDTAGSIIAMDVGPNVPYMIDWRRFACGKNVLLCAITGSGKTFLMLFNLLDYYVDRYNIVIRDIKGTDYKTICEALNGVTIPLRQDSGVYPNTFILRASDVKDGDYLKYYNTRFNWSVTMLTIISQIKSVDSVEVRNFYRDFVANMYTQLGVLKDNPNTWGRTENITPNDIYSALVRYLSPEMSLQYETIGRACLKRIKMFFAKDGSYNYVFSEPLDIATILDSRILRFDFGYLENGDSDCGNGEDDNELTDQTLFNLHYFFSSIYSEVYIAHKKNLSEWTVVVNEEAQSVGNYVLRMYAKDFSLGRARNQITYVICNAIDVLEDNPVAAPILQGATLLLLGNMYMSSRRYFIEQYSLQKYEDIFERISEDTEYENHFVLVNNMQKEATTAVVSALVPNDVAGGEIFRNVDTVENEDIER